jgi:predicted nucleic acid-binding protein
MRESIVINTTPILTIIAACGNLQILEKLYGKIIVPLEVKEEILEGGKSLFGVDEFLNSKCLTISQTHVVIPNHLSEFLDKGEASVISSAIEKKIPLVCIDETEGRRFARIEKLTLTGSLGILLKARKNKIIPYSMKEIIPKIVEHGIWLSERVISEVLAEDNSN